MESEINKKARVALRDARTNRQLSVRQAAEGLSGSYSRLHYEESGRTRLTLSRFVEIARALNESPVELFKSVVDAPTAPKTKDND